jgi:hypothetical protein
MAAIRNGQLPASALSNIPGGRLRNDGAARSWLAMRQLIGRRSNIWLSPTGPNSSYRSLEVQKRFYSAYLNGTGNLAAKPGTSNHGLGHAVDLPTTAMQAQVRRYGHLFGWGIAGGKLGSDAPSEPWHATYYQHRASKARVALWYGRYVISKRRKKR